MPISVNSDGLSIRYGLSQGTVNVIGAPAQAGANKSIVIDFGYQDLDAYTVSNSFFGGTPDVCIPAGSQIISATLYVTTAFDSGSTATLGLGFVKFDGTELDYDGLDVTIAETAIDTIGKVVACDGVLIADADGAVLLTHDAYPSYDVGTASYTVGQARLVIVYYHPVA